MPLIVHWPAGTDPDQRGTKRTQFANVADVVPTLYDLLGVTAPDVYRGIEQLPVTGHSFASVLGRRATRPPPTPCSTSRWPAAGRWSRGSGRPCRSTRRGADYDTERWELYHLTDDPSECHDLADAEPERLAELIELWWDEAERHGVLPLDDRLIELFGARFRDHSPHPVDRRYVYRPPMLPIPAQASAAIGGRSFDLTARVTRAAGEEGVLWSTGTENSGISVFVQDDRLVVDYNAFDAHVIVESTVAVPEGDVELTARFRRGDGMSGSVAVAVDGVDAGAADLPLFMRVISSVGSSIGFDHGSPVSARYEAPFAFGGTLHEVVIELVSPRAPRAPRPPTPGRGWRASSAVRPGARSSPRIHVGTRSNRDAAVAESCPAGAPASPSPKGAPWPTSRTS